MDTISQLQKQFVDYITPLYHEGYLDELFTQFLNMQDETNPDFLFETIGVYFAYSDELVNNIAIALEQQQVNFNQVDNQIYKFMGSSASIGAFRVKNVCSAFKSFCDTQNLAGCKRCLEQLKREYALLKDKLNNLFMLERQLRAAGGSIPIIE